jgi:hypothetical protein
MSSMVSGTTQFEKRRDPIRAFIYARGLKQPNELSADSNSIESCSKRVVVGISEHRFNTFLPSVVEDIGCGVVLNSAESIRVVKPSNYRTY